MSRWKQKNSSNSNVNFIGIAVFCICVLVVYQFTFGTLVTVKNRSTNQRIYDESLSSDANLINSTPSQLNIINKNSSTLDQDLNNDNKTTINNKSENPSLFADNKLWFQEKMTNHSKDVNLLNPLNKTKRILFWNKAFGGGVG